MRTTSFEPILDVDFMLVCDDGGFRAGRGDRQFISSPESSEETVSAGDMALCTPDFGRPSLLSLVLDVDARDPWLSWEPLGRLAFPPLPLSDVSPRLRITVLPQSSNAKFSLGRVCILSEGSFARVVPLCSNDSYARSIVYDVNVVPRGTVIVTVCR